MATVLTLHQGGISQEERREKRRAAVEALEELYAVMPPDDTLRRAVGILSGALELRLGGSWE